jgi:hypothetical protein
MCTFSKYAMCFINKVVHGFDDLMHFLNFSLEFLLGMLVITNYKARLCCRFKELMNVQKIEGIFFIKERTTS